MPEARSHCENNFRRIITSYYYARFYAREISEIQNTHIYFMDVYNTILSLVVRMADRRREVFEYFRDGFSLKLTFHCKRSSLSFSPVGLDEALCRVVCVFSAETLI